MSDHFNVGDVVMCVDDSITFPHSTNIKRGKVYRISGFYQPAEAGLSGLGRLAPFGVFLAGMRALSASGSYDPARFRRFPKADEQFTAQIRALKPNRVTA